MTARRRARRVTGASVTVGGEVVGKIGPGLVILDQWKTDRPRETVLLDGKLPAGCAMHADLSFDGRRVVFAYADPKKPAMRCAPTWRAFARSCKS